MTTEQELEEIDAMSLEDLDQHMDYLIACIIRAPSTPEREALRAQLSHVQDRIEELSQ